MANGQRSTAASSPSHLPEALAVVTCGSGFHEEEVAGADRFRWMGETGVLTCEPAAGARYLELWALSEFHDLSQELACAGAGWSERCQLVAGWAPLSIEVPPGTARVELVANKLFPPAYYPADRRRLSVRLRQPRLHADALRHAAVARQHANAVVNARELLLGQSALASTPVTLGIDLHGDCNVKPPCVYCEWDFNKAAEGDNVGVPFTLGTLDEWGPLFDNSVNLVNCSIGEPFMMKDFDDLLDRFGRAGKALEMTTNGQILTDRNIRRLVGRTIDLYISLDAATPETYSRLRNRRFDAILANLRRLIAAKGGPGQLPHVHLVFMPMRANVHELERFIDLCADLGVDRLVLRPLNHSEEVTLTSDRAGYRFDYQRELLPFDELVRVSGMTAAWCERAGVPLADQMDFGGSLGADFTRWFEEGRRAAGERRSRPTPETTVVPPPPADASPVPRPPLGAELKPACTEPWTSLYILRRGVFPCCYGGAPIAAMSEYREAWNAPVMQDIRRDLAKGRFHSYCLRSPACPIVQKSEHAGELPVGQRAWLWQRHRWPFVLRRLTRAVDSVRSQYVFWSIRARRVLVERGYARRHIRRIWQQATDRLLG